MVRHNLDFLILVFEFLHQNRYSGLELFDFNFVEDFLGLISDLSQFVLPVLSHGGNFILKILLLVLCLLDVLACDSRVHACCILLGLEDEVSLQVHELGQTLVFLELQNKDIRLTLSFSKFYRHFPCVIACLSPQLVKLVLLLVKRVSEAVQLLLKGAVIRAKSFKLLTVQLLLMLETRSDSLLFFENKL